MLLDQSQNVAGRKCRILEVELVLGKKGWGVGQRRESRVTASSKKCR